MQKAPISFLLHKAVHYAAKRRLFLAFLAVSTVIATVDILFHHWVYPHYMALVDYWFDGSETLTAVIDTGFAPEVWIAVLAMVLGTLIIVISIASQNIPKLIDLYMEDWTSLFYIWFLVISGMHAMIIDFHGTMGLERVSSKVLNIHFLLSISMLLALPYIFYILTFTTPSHCINKIYGNNIRCIRSFLKPRINRLFSYPSIVEEYQLRLFESMNQLDDLLAYVSFNEPKAEIIQKMGMIIHEYIKVKKELNPLFFQVAPRARSDISFKTMVGQFSDIEKKGTFYEQKYFRLMGNIYIKFLDDHEFDLASLCIAEITSMGRFGLQIGDVGVIDTVMSRCNTLLRLAIKHGVKDNEPRHLYNYAFHYGMLMEEMVRARQAGYLQDCFNYLRIYGVEIFKHGATSPNMYFIVDVITAEMKKILIMVHQDGWEQEIQERMLREVLQVDNPLDVNRAELDWGMLMNNGVRILQIELALYYLRHNVDAIVTQIIDDILDDLKVFGEEKFRQVIEQACSRITAFTPRFWEDTDRGNVNIYYSPDKDQVEAFKNRLFARATEHAAPCTN